MPMLNPTFDGKNPTETVKQISGNSRHIGGVVTGE
jgi:hypothetical protein